MKWPEKIVVSAGKNIMGETLLSVEMESEFAGPDERVYVLAPQPKRRKAGRKPARAEGEEMTNEKIREIDMSAPENFNKAIELALAASDPKGWCEQKAEDLHALAQPEQDLWTVYNDGDSPDGCAVIAITGNGKKSRANAEFIVNARPVVLGLVSEIDRLRTIIRNNGRAALQSADKKAGAP